jgi:hypothetical protein
MARLRRKSCFNVADLVVALTYGSELDPWVSDRDALTIAARAGPSVGQLAKATAHAFAEVCTANQRVVSTVGGIRSDAHHEQPCQRLVKASGEGVR